MKGFSKVKANEVGKVAVTVAHASLSTREETITPAGNFQRWSIGIPGQCQDHFMLYKFLKKNFGDPSYSAIPKINGKYTNIHYKKYGSDKQQWVYEIKTPHGFINIYDKERSYVYFFGYTEVKENDYVQKNLGMSDISPIDIETDNRIPIEFKQDLHNFFTELIAYCSKFRNLNKKLHRGFIIPNPYSVHFNNFRYHLKLLIKSSKILRTKHYPDNAYFTSFSNAKNLASSSFILLMASFEGFVELMYTIFVKEQISDDLDKFLGNQRLEMKIKLLPLVCDEFNQFNKTFLTTKEYTHFTQLMKIRNRLLHGNITDTRVTYIVEEDGFLFYLGEQENDLPFHPSSEYRFEDETTKFFTKAEKTIKKLIDEILSMIEPKKRKLVRKILNEEWIGCVKTKKGIEFVTEQIW